MSTPRTTIALSLLLVGCGGDERATSSAADAGSTTVEGTTVESTGDSEDGSTGANDDGVTTGGDESAEGSTDSGTSEGSTSTGPAFEDIPVTISFDEFESGVDITDQYGEFVVFSSIPGSTNRTRASGAVASSEPRFICTTSSLCREDTYLDFTHPVSNISFAIVGQCSGTFKARIYVDGVEHATVPMQASGCDGPEIFELPEYQDVTRLELIEIDDGSGVGWDDFSFVAHVPLGD